MAIDHLTTFEQWWDVVLGPSILYLLEEKDREEAISKVHQMLKPRGIFVTSTTCMSNMMPLFKFIVPVGRFLRVMPLVKVFTVQELVENLTSEGFEIDYQWQPSNDKAVFIVAKKAGSVLLLCIRLKLQQFQWCDYSSL